MISLDELKIPKAARSLAEETIAATDGLCLEYLDEEYADLCRRMTGALARKRPTPLSRGDLRIWAAGVIYAVGQVNFLFDRAEEPYLSADELSGLMGVKKTTMANKGRLIRDMLKVRPFGAEYGRRDIIDRNPLVWMLEVNGLPVDARMLPPELQVYAFERGLIPYVPGETPNDG